MSKYDNVNLKSYSEFIPQLLKHRQLLLLESCETAHEDSDQIHEQQQKQQGQQPKPILEMIEQTKQ